MRPTLAKWVSDADAVRQFEHFEVAQQLLDLAYVRDRSDDYYIALVGELFDKLRDGFPDSTHWAKLGNALAQYAILDRENALRSGGISTMEANLFAAAAFYFGGFPASAYVTLNHQQFRLPNETWTACFDLLARPAEIRSTTIRSLLNALRTGQMDGIAQIQNAAIRAQAQALNLCPEDWIPARLLNSLLTRFSTTNFRAVLPEGNTEFWTPFIASLLDRRPPAWEFFPSQIQAIQSGLLSRPDTCSLQMPTGAGKTALTETLLYWHLKRNPNEIAILLVPYRSLASELRATLVRRLNGVGISARAAYGGTIPSNEEINDLDELQALVATPETLSGLLAANPAFLRRVSLVICDEGHLLDGDSRGISLELLLARMKVREGGQPRFVFISAIVPNIEEINGWLSGDVNAGFVVRSDYRPALAEFAVLNPRGSGANTTVALVMHPHEAATTRFSITGFLANTDFRYTNPESGRQRTYPFTSVKTQALAAARKALPMGAVAVFAANKRGDQGAVGLAEGLLAQLEHPLNLPLPSAHIVVAAVEAASQYLTLEYGNNWVGTKALRAGAVLHHGDIPQETREVIESLLRLGQVKFAICTSTLAEGVNLPIRTLVLYSVQRRQAGGAPVDMLGRDIKNLVGRAGRAGATTKGLVICANSGQWPLVQPVAQQAAGEPVHGALLSLINRVRSALAVQNIELSNPLLESSPSLHSLVDGVDSTLIDLATEEIGQERLVEIATQLADKTFAAQQVDAASKVVLQSVFRLRAEKVASVRETGRLDWIRETGARLRMIDIVESGLLPKRETWDNIIDPISAEFVTIILSWAWEQPSLNGTVRHAYRLDDGVDTDSVRASFFEMVRLWLTGSSFQTMSEHLNLSVDELLGIYTAVISFELQTLVEQGVALLSKLLASQERSLSPAVQQFPEHLRFGVPNVAARILAAEGLRHRRAAVDLGSREEFGRIAVPERQNVFATAQRILHDGQQEYRARLGILMFDHTRRDLANVTRQNIG